MQVIPRESRRHPVSVDPRRSARQAGLVYLPDQAPGIRRIRRGDTFRYRDAENRPVRDRQTLQRIRSLVIPPAWERVWISPDENGHLQATGYDVKGRKQYRYHPEWNAVRNATKFHRLLAFAEVLPRIREQVEQDLRRQGLPYEKVLALVIRLMEKTSIRVGNEEYKKQNGSFGLTTLQDEHAVIEGATITFHFRGKKGIWHDIHLKDKRLARLVQRCKDIPGEELFQYTDENGEPRRIDSGAVNSYLKGLTGEDFTAKDFRTWRGTVAAFEAFREMGPFDSPTAGKHNISRCYDLVAEALGNTRAVCKKYYVHPKVLSIYESGQFHAFCQGLENEPSGGCHALSPLECRVKQVLEAAGS